MAYCPSCANELAASDTKCIKCGADFTASDGWKPLERRPESDVEGRPLRWWQKVLWFLAFWVVTINLLKLLGADAVTQLVAGIIGGMFGTFWMNTRAIKRSKAKANAT
jgi:uncharacterized membrane protein YvbJ